jgi:DNA-binding NarL/FixJ family response regulator
MEPIPETGVMTDTGVAVICGHRLLSEAICEELAEFTDLRAVAADSYLDDIDELVATQHPDVLVLDGCLTRAHGRAALGRFHLSRSSPAVVLLSDHDDPEEIDAAVKWGAQAVVLKIPPPKELADAIRYAARGDMWLSPPLLTDVLASDRNAEGPGARATDMELSSLGAPETLSLGERAVRPMPASSRRHSPSPSKRPTAISVRSTTSCEAPPPPFCRCTAPMGTSRSTRRSTVDSRRDNQPRTDTQNEGARHRS